MALDNRKIIVIGASPNPDRYAYKATYLLKEKGFNVYPLGIRKGEINGVQIVNEKALIEKVDTITMYVGRERQLDWEDYIFKIKPRRVIFNPGTENEEFANRLVACGIETENTCTLVLLSRGVF